MLVPVLLALGIGAAFLREVIFAKIWGTSYEMEVFRLAFSIPNLLSQSVAPAFLAAVIPMLVASADTNSRAVSARHIININLIGSMAMSTAGILFSRGLAKLLAPGFDSNQITYLASQIQLAWVYFLIVSLTFGIRAILNARNTFWPSASSAFLINATFVFACWAALSVFHRQDLSVSFLMYTAIAAASLVFVSHCLHSDNVVIIYLKNMRTSSPAAAHGMRVISQALLAVVIFKVSYAVPRVIDRAVGSELGSGVVAALDYSFGLINVPGILLATSVITVAYPGFSRFAGGEMNSASLRRYFVLFAVVVLLATGTGLLLSGFATQVVSVIYERGNFDTSAGDLTSELLKWHSLALGPMVASLILTQALFAFGAYRMALGLVAVRVITKLIAVHWLVPMAGVSGLGLSFIGPEIVTLCGALGMVLLLVGHARNKRAS